MLWNNKPELFGLLDIGSHTIKLYILEIQGREKKWKIIDSLWMPIQLGKDILTRGVIRQETLTDLHNILKRYQETLQSYRIKEIKAFITSALSEASNSESVISRCESILGVPVTIIHPHQENEAIYLAISDIIQGHPELRQQGLLICHVGSGSSRIFIQQRGNLLFSQTYHTGILRFSQFLPTNPAAYESYFFPFIKQLSATLKSVLGEENLSLVLLNDDIVHMVEHLGYKEKHGLYEIRRQELERMSFHFLSLPPEDLVLHYNISDTAVQSIKLSLVFFLSLLHYLNLSTLYLPHTLSTFGFAYELFQKKETSLIPIILSSAKTIAKRYLYDAEHAHKVMEYGCLLFDKLQKPYHLEQKERLYLQLAALLHDIGYFVSATNHHKNTYDLLRNTEIFGLSPEEILYIALIARYHRRSAPKKTHGDFMNLDMHERIMITRLSAMLRLANAMDSCHQQVIRHLEIKLTEHSLHLLCHIEPRNQQAFEVIENAIHLNKTFFENFFGIKVVVEKL
ncbi:Ppx/GppA phosphatase family protein [Thermospira aquatica]|uniref:HD domain-containing protein n=1 Tax=Thermospira aquatica TaxID=2828656 RepID=A0AAX3BC82_9SPIR|nr:HD domain-containing protein [Thermospira aquatica]URA09928.1 HD domain-containing protein [Thermospira aquatica]